MDITDSLGNSIKTLRGNLSGSNSLDSQIANYWNKREQIDRLVAKGADISTSESEKLKSLTSEIGGIATSIQSSAGNSLGMTESLIADLSQLNSKIDFSSQVLKVNVVDGLGDLLGLSQEQLGQLKNFSKDGEITSKELSLINSLTQTQKDGIIEFANNSNYFSTEDTLSSLSEYMRKQLEVLQKTQALSISKNPYEDIKKIVGFNGEDFTDWNTYNQLVAFDPESAVNNIGSVSDMVNQYTSGNTITKELTNLKNGIIELLGKIDEKLKTIEASTSKSTKVLESAQIGARPLATKAS